MIIDNTSTAVLHRWLLHQFHENQPAVLSESGQCREMVVQHWPLVELSLCNTSPHLRDVFIATLTRSTFDHPSLRLTCSSLLDSV